MPQKCDSCSRESYVLYLRSDLGFICPDCEDKVRLKEAKIMPRKKPWGHSEKKILMDNYYDKTIKELLDLLPGRSEDSVNTQIKRLKAAGKISGEKSEAAIKRAYEQRGKSLEE
jgi:hypothetical protein